MTRLHGMGFPLGSFSPSRYLANGVEALPEVVTGLAGNARLLYEWASGGPIAGVDPCAPRAPHSGTQGHDHSGGVMGAPLQYTLWSHAMGVPKDTVVSDLLLGTAPRNRVSSGHAFAGLYDNAVGIWWVPGCPPDGCYWTLRLQCVVYATANVNLYATWACNGWSATQTQTVASGALRSIYYDTLVPTVPGQRQSLRLSVRAGYLVSSGTSDVSLCHVGLHQVATSA